jgi:mRNA interferase MazF
MVSGGTHPPLRGEVWLVALDPTQGSEVRKTRPCLIVSPDETNRYLSTVIVAPLTTTVRGYPTRVNLRFKGKRGEAALDQIRTTDKSRLVKRLGQLPDATASEVAAVLVEMFRWQ